MGVFSVVMASGTMKEGSGTVCHIYFVGGNLRRNNNDLNREAE